MKGRVIKSTGSWYVVRLESGAVHKSRLRGKFKNEDLKVNNPITVGDWVEIEVEDTEEKSAIISEIHPRDNYIIRKSTRKTGFSHLLASNVDQALLLATITFPRTSVGFIDRFLVSAESFRIPALVVFNKADLLNKKQLEKCNELMGLYNRLGYTSILISLNEEQAIDQILELTKRKTTLIAGHSGVGKSTLLNQLVPGLELRTGPVSTFANKGTHTTTFAEMFEGSDGANFIDTPGIKELGLVDMESYEISHYFPEMRKYLGQCKFNNCLHINEPNCRVIEALEKGEIHPSRFNSYLSILEDYDNRR